MLCEDYEVGFDFAPRNNHNNNDNDNNHPHPNIAASHTGKGPSCYHLYSAELLFTLHPNLYNPPLYRNLKNINIYTYIYCIIHFLFEDFLVWLVSQFSVYVKKCHVTGVAEKISIQKIQFCKYLIMSPPSRLIHWWCTSIGDLCSTREQI